MKPKELVPTGSLKPGQVGYFLSNMKSVKDAHVGDTFFKEGDKIEPFPGYESPLCVVFAGVYPEDPNDYDEISKALEKLCLTDGSVSLNFEASAALGSGFRCGFLGMLHMDVFRQRLFEEHDLSAIITQPNVSYLCTLRNKEEKVRVDNPVETPKPELISMWEEAIMRTTIMTPQEYAKNVKQLCIDRRGYMKDEDFISGGKVISLVYEIPLSELITDFFDTLKSLTQGYASLDYEHSHWQEAPIQKVVYYLNGDPIDALSFLVHE